MPRVHTQKARTDIYRYGKKIKDTTTKSGYRLDRSQPENKQDEIIVTKGSTYYWWKFRYGGKHISMARPKPSQLTQSEFLSTIYDIQEELESLDVSNFDSAEDLQTFVEEIVGRLEELRDEQESKRDNMPESLQDAPTGELLQNRYDSVDEMINELEGISCDDYDEPDESDLKEEAIEELGWTDGEENLEENQDELNEKIEDLRKAKFEEWAEEKIGELSAISYNGE